MENARQAILKIVAQRKLRLAPLFNLDGWVSSTVPGLYLDFAAAPPLVVTLERATRYRTRGEAMTAGQKVRDLAGNWALPVELKTAAPRDYQTMIDIERQVVAQA